ncbi:MAG: hypothetical protein HYV07_24170 [Deltaproteobacteria bacterium]|nr:hypothetical protein [Deltaproteobacteria bacterium]
MTDAPARKKISPAGQALGRRMVAQIHQVIRTFRIHDSGNRALTVATETLRDTINNLFDEVGPISIQFVDDQVYLNEVRLRADATTLEHARLMYMELRTRNMGGLAFSKPVDTPGLQAFLTLLAAPVETAEDLSRLRRSLEGLRDLAIDLLGPRTLADDPDAPIEEVRIDKKTFALQTYAKAQVAAREAVDALREGRDPLEGRLSPNRVVQDMVDIATERVNFLLKLGVIKSSSDYHAAHAANVCVLSIILGKGLGLDRLDLAEVGLAGLIADLGFALMPQDLLDERRELTPEEKQEVLGEMIQGVRGFIGKGRISASTIRRVIVAYEHHQPFLRPEGAAPLHPFSRIVAVADAYDALTTARPWREGFTADEALRILIGEAGTRFDPIVVKTLTNLMGLYPLGSYVRLDSNEIAVVYHNSNDPDLFEKPWVRVVADAKGQPITRTVIRKLAEFEGLGSAIVEFVGSDEIKALGVVGGTSFA